MKETKKRRNPRPTPTWSLGESPLPDAAYHERLGRTGARYSPYRASLEALARQIRKPGEPSPVLRYDIAEESLSRHQVRFSIKRAAESMNFKVRFADEVGALLVIIVEAAD